LVWQYVDQGEAWTTLTSKEGFGEKKGVEYKYKFLNIKILLYNLEPEPDINQKLSA
jgi:hypothetical protein